MMNFWDLERSTISKSCNEGGVKSRQMWIIGISDREIEGVGAHTISSGTVEEKLKDKCRTLRGTVKEDNENGNPCLKYISYRHVWKCRLFRSQWFSWGQSVEGLGSFPRRCRFDSKRKWKKFFGGGEHVTLSNYTHGNPAYVLILG